MLYPQLTPTRCVVSLNGMWELAREHKPDNQHEGFKAEKHVAVPASYNDLYAEEGFRMWKDGMWYQREFAVPKTLQGERLVLRFGAVAYRARVFVNGRDVGSHEGGHESSSALAALLSPSSRCLDVDPPGTGPCHV